MPARNYFHNDLLAHVHIVICLLVCVCVRWHACGPLRCFLLSFWHIQFSRVPATWEAVRHAPYAHMSPLSIHMNLSLFIALYMCIVSFVLLFFFYFCHFAIGALPKISTAASVSCSTHAFMWTSACVCVIQVVGSTLTFAVLPLCVLAIRPVWHKIITRNVLAKWHLVGALWSILWNIAHTQRCNMKCWFWKRYAQELIKNYSSWKKNITYIEALFRLSIDCRN